MANEKNLIPFNKRTKSERIKIAKQGGKKSGEVRREKKNMREALQMLLERDYNIDGQILNGVEATGVALIKQALNGNVKAFEVIRDTIGEKPTVPVSVCANDQALAAYERAAALIKDTKK